MEEYMKKILIGSLLAASAFLQSGCGVADSVNGGCRGSDLEGLCDFVFGYKDRQQDENIDANLELIFSMAQEIGKEINKGDEKLQLEINALQAQLTLYATQQKSVSLIDPCDDYPGYYDEVLMRIEDGRLVAFFEDNGRRYLTILIPNVAYQTTDKQKCVFKIDQYNQIVYPVTKY